MWGGCPPDGWGLSKVGLGGFALSLSPGRGASSPPCCTWPTDGIIVREGRRKERKKQKTPKSKKEGKKEGQAGRGHPAALSGRISHTEPPGSALGGGLGAPPPLAPPQERSGMEATARPEPEPERSAGSVQLGKEIIIKMVLINKRERKAEEPRAGLPGWRAVSGGRGEDGEGCGERGSGGGSRGRVRRCCPCSCCGPGSAPHPVPVPGPCRAVPSRGAGPGGVQRPGGRREGGRGGRCVARGLLDWT